MSSVDTGAAAASAYRDQLATRQRALGDRDRAHRWAGRVRVSIVIAATLVILILRLESAPWLIALGVAFVGAAIWHARVLDARDRAARAVAWYERGLARLEDRWMDGGDTGDRFRPRDHPYADDLDIFGRGSVFQLLSTARTQAGQERLSAWLLSPAPPAEIRERQYAVRELAGRPALREAMAVEGEGVHLQAVALRQWARSPPLLPPRAVTATVLAVLSAVNITLLAIYLTAGRYGLASLSVMTLQGIVALWLHGRVAEVIRTVDTPARDLTVVANLLRVLERETFAAPALQRLSAAIGASERRASAEIAHLDRLVGRLTWRRDMLFGIPAALMLWATQCALAIDAWRRRAGPLVGQWLDAVGEFEAFAALATFAAEHPRYPFPTIEANDAPAVTATELAHPLLPQHAVANDLALGRPAPRLLVVSGSNMSGKTTLLRAVGVNLVLAQAGAPVRAATFRASPLDIGASLRPVDSLQDGRSRFFAEITRLKLIVDLSRARGGRVIFLLDEILSGTNSHDRAHGAEALLRGLLAKGAIGLVTTHDLALSRIAETLAADAANVHFADEFDAGGLQFNFRLRPGPVRTSNALALMRSIGLEV